MSDYFITYENDFEDTSVITLEVLCEKSREDVGTDNPNFTHNIEVIENVEQNTEKDEVQVDEKVQEEVAETKARTDLLEYVTRSDGSVICKLCGEILQSRTHWYRHKYKVHVLPTQLNPATLFQCEQCLVFFKSRKGYIGHLASRHSEMLSDSNPVLTNSQAEVAAEKSAESALDEGKTNTDAELSIPKSTVPNHNTNVKPAKNTTPEGKKPVSKLKADQSPTKSDWAEKRSREEKLVTDIIDRVRRECEAQGAGGPTRRGYSRRTTVMHT